VLTRFRLTIALAALTGLLAVAAPSQAALPKLTGTVGPGFTITLTKSGKKVKSLTAGTYKIVVKDLSSAHNFVLEKARGGKFEKSITSVAFTGKKTVTVKLTQGKWEFYCAPHEAQMRGEFTVH
jgi:plastocyanin